jgi:serine/threonine protein kinase/formylglycine-generating enzyme required for sulfatase activity
MPPYDKSLPSDLTSALLRLLQADDVSFASGLADLCRSHPQHAESLARAAGEARAARNAGQGPNPMPSPATAELRSGRGPLDDARLGSRIGEFHIQARLGEGGMGVVYLAEQRGAVHRRVALKVIKLGMDTQAVLARFEAERQALAMMNHSNIAKVFEAGSTVDGRPYFAMEYVQGIPINAYCDRNLLSIEDRLALFRQVCSGVQHAHTKGVVHRDLTPNNVLVSLQDGQASVKIIDFGLARATDRRLTEKTLFTEQGVILGTPEYMSPEQAGLNALDVDMRTDVYTLGVLLYELLTGRLPFDAKELRAGGYDVMCKTIREADPPRPSTKVTTHAGGTAAVAKLRRTDAGTLLARLRGDLDWIVLKCLEKDRTRRYETVRHLADDVERYLDSQPVLARAPSATYRFGKFARRHRVELSAGVFVVLTTVAGLASTTTFWLDAKKQARVADEERAEAKRQAALAQLSAADAIARKAEYDQLAAGLRLTALEEAEEALYPAWPHKAPDLRTWIERAERLLRDKPGIDRTIAELRLRGLALSAAEIGELQAKNPQMASWRKLSLKLAAMERAHRVRQGAEISLPAPTAAESAMSSAELNPLAWPLVDFDEGKRIWGDEPRALTLARLAWEKAAQADAEHRAEVGDTLAWALFANGLDGEAIAQAEAVVGLASGLASDTEKERFRRFAAMLRAEVAAASGANGPKKLAALREQLQQLAAATDAPRFPYRFGDESQSFLHDALSKLSERLDSLKVSRLENVAERLHWAERVRALTREHPHARVSWQAARAAIKAADGVVASTAYKQHAIDLSPQTGLVPIGMNPRTKLWEFYDLRSAFDGDGDPTQIEIPCHVEKDGDAGHVVVGDETGVVFVLLPGGVFTMGSQREDPREANYDPDAVYDETPNDVELAPFFIARHELTQAQWKRLTGEKPSFYPAERKFGRGGPISWSNPVEQISWNDCERWLFRSGMVLPTEAQWEYSCRGDTTTPWWTGVERASLRGCINIADQTAKREGAAFPAICDWADLDDGFMLHAPVDSLRANAFGLHHVCGNVCEWTADSYFRYTTQARDGDGLRGDPAGASDRVLRGSSFQGTALQARSAFRIRYAPKFQANLLGVRPARPLQVKQD